MARAAPTSSSRVSPRARSLAAAALVLVASSSGCGGSGSSFKWSDTGASWSPDGRSIVFVSNRAHPKDPDGYRLYVMQADGSGMKRLAGGGGSPQFPSFSPDGRKILYLEYRSGSDATVSVTDPEGGPPSELATTVNYWVIPPAWSPDGRRIAFVRDRSESDPDSATDLWVMNADGRRSHVAARDIDTAEGYSAEFAWSRDGRRLVFGCRGALCSVNARGGAIHRMTPIHRGLAESLSWSPDGDQIAFITCGCDGGRARAWIVDARRAHELALPRGTEGGPTSLAWVPQRAGMLVESGNQGRIVVRSSRSHGRRELRLAGFDRAAAPSPDGTRIVFEEAGPIRDGSFFGPSSIPQPSKLFVTDLAGRRLTQLTQKNSDRSRAP